MNELVKRYEEDQQSDPEKETEYLKKYNKMFEDPSTHHVNPETTKSIDQAFAEGMIMHHQMAVDMSRDSLEFTDHDEIRQLAQSIIDAQEKEIEEMQDVYKRQIPYSPPQRPPLNCHPLRNMAQVLKEDGNEK